MLRAYIKQTWHVAMAWPQANLAARIVLLIGQPLRRLETLMEQCLLVFFIGQRVFAIKKIKPKFTQKIHPKELN